VSQYFLDNANGIALDNFTVRTGDGETASDLYLFLGQDFGFGAQQGFLGYESFLLDAADPNNLAGTTYLSNTGTGTFNQDYLLQTVGYNSKLSFNGAIELNNKWNLGVNLNSHTISTERFTSIEESNSNADATVSNVRFDNTLFTDANGFSFQLGLIGKLTKSLRVGATYESPTWYSIDESQIQEISTRAPGNASIVRVRPNVVNVFAPYRLRSPGSFTGSLAYIFGKSGLLSLDYSITDHSQMRFRPENSSIFRDNNRFINENLQRASTLSIGGEYRIERVTLRGGYRFEESPYENTEIMGNLNGYSFGLGYTWGKTVLDISYDRAERDFSQQLFDTGLNTRAGVMNQMDNIILTIGFNL
jgi:long-subunit fatty acid transport protein